MWVVLQTSVPKEVCPSFKELLFVSTKGFPLYKCGHPDKISLLQCCCSVAHKWRKHILASKLRVFFQSNLFHAYNAFWSDFHLKFQSDVNKLRVLTFQPQFYLCNIQPIDKSCPGVSPFPATSSYSRYHYGVFWQVVAITTRPVGTISLNIRWKQSVSQQLSSWSGISFLIFRNFSLAFLNLNVKKTSTWCHLVENGIFFTEKVNMINK